MSIGVIGWALHLTWSAWVVVGGSAALIWTARWRFAFGVGIVMFSFASIVPLVTTLAASASMFVAFGTAAVLSACSFANDAPGPRWWRIFFAWVTKVREGELDVGELQWRQRFFLFLGVTLAVFAVQLDYVEYAIWMLLIGGLLFRWDHRIAASFAAAFLGVTPVLLIMGREPKAEITAIYVYYFLVVTTIQLLAASRRDDGGIELFDVAPAPNPGKEKAQGTLAVVHEDIKIAEL